MRTGTTVSLLAGAVTIAALAALGMRTPDEQGARAVRTTLSAAAVKPGPGAPNASGTLSIQAKLGQEEVCYELSVSGVAGASAAHVHLGAEGAVGPSVVTLATPADGSAKGCVTVNRALVRDLIEEPADYYADVHSAAFPKGAVRGQLSR